jgi:hypothetical protein
MAYAAALFGDAVLRGLNGATATECAYVESDVTDVPYFATKVKLGTEGEYCLCPHDQPLKSGTAIVRAARENCHGARHTLQCRCSRTWREALYRHSPVKQSMGVNQIHIAVVLCCILYFRC